MILVDTSIWIEYLSPVPGPNKAILKRLISENEPISLNGLILTEVLQGIKKDKDYIKIKELLLGFSILNFSLEEYILASHVYREGRKRGITIRSTIDCIIAAMANNRNLYLFHNDKDYNQISNIVALKFYP